MLALPVAAGPVDWAHQNGSVQSNGGVTVKSLSGGSYSATGNPRGAVAKANQNAATQPPTVVIQATSGNAQFALTTNSYTGDLGGKAGADAKCAAEYGGGWKFATAGQLVTAPPYIAGYQFWVHANNSCVGWTNATNGQYAAAWYMQGTNFPYWTSVSSQCNYTKPLMCTTM